MRFGMLFMESTERQHVRFSSVSAKIITTAMVGLLRSDAACSSVSGRETKRPKPLTEHIVITSHNIFIESG